jgi:N-glycosidase YbiA
MDEYLQKLELFYDEKMKYLTKKDKYTMCNDCKTKKTFNETNEKLILSCGSDKGECGPQIIIKLPKHIHYEKHLASLKNSINDEYNWDVLQKYLDVSKNADESKQKNIKINEEIKRIERLFFEKNMELKQSEIQEFYDQRIRKTKKCNEINEFLKDKKLSVEQKKEYHQEYIRNVQEMKKQYIDINEMVQEINPFLIENEPEVTILHDNYEYQKQKPKEKKDKKAIQSVDKIFEENMEVSWLFKGKMKKGTIIELKGKGALVKDEKGKEKIRLLNTLTPIPQQLKEENEIMKYFSNSKDNKWLSTFNKANPFEYEGLIYSTVEHAFHSQKVNDEKKEEFQRLFTDKELEPNEAKKLGGRKYFEEMNYSLRKDWNSIKLQVMKDITKSYYLANPEMLQKLKETDDKILTHAGFRIDNFWGVKNDEGENNHGKILMKIREEL